MASIAEGNTKNATKGFMGFIKGAQDKMNEGVQRAQEEGGKVSGELSEDLAKQREKATSGWGNLKGKWKEQTAKAKAKVDQTTAQFEEYKASNAGKTLNEKMTEGANGLKQGAEDAYQQGVDSYEAAGQATDVAKQEAARVHAEEVLKLESDDGQEERTEGEGEEQRTEGEGEQRKMEGGRRRRRRRSRKKKKKSKRKSRRKKTRKRKSRKSRKKRRKKSKKSRRRRRR